VVEQLTVNQLVVGSNPSPGARVLTFMTIYDNILNNPGRPGIPSCLETEMPMPTLSFSSLNGVKTGDILKLRFHERAADDLIYAQAMDRAGVIKIDDKDMTLVMAIAATGDFDGDKNRNLTVTVGERWSYDFFVGRMRRALESIEVIPIQPAPGSPEFKQALLSDDLLGNAWE
jgi:hypothetical protein